MSERELKGALFFSDSHPHITGYLVVCGVEYEIAGWKASEIRSEIKARKRGPVKETQQDIFDELGGSGEGERG